MSFRAFRWTTVLRAAANSSKPVLTAAEREVALREANEKMKAYFVHQRPPPNKAKNAQRQAEHRVQFAMVASFVAALIASGFLGRRIARDEEFRKAYIPRWYDYSIEKPKNAWTRQELHEQMVQVQHELHERAIRGEFTEQKLEEMRRHLHGVDPDDDEHGWGKIHPGVDDDEDIEEEV